MASFYAVKIGRRPGVYHTWKECQKEVLSFSGAVFKKFQTLEEAKKFANEDCDSNLETNSKKTASSEAKSAEIAPFEKTYTENEPINKFQGNKRSFESSEIGSAKKAKYEPSVSLYTKKQKTIVYTDGACSGNGQTSARAGYGVFWGDNDPRNTSERLDGNQTNQRAEATAVIHALKQSQTDSEPLEVRTDSKYVIKAVTDWSTKWKMNGWKSTKNKPVENKDVLKKILDLVDSRKGPVEFVYVPGHSGEEGNEKADQLAVAGAQK